MNDLTIVKIHSSGRDYVIGAKTHQAAVLKAVEVLGLKIETIGPAEALIAVHNGAALAMAETDAQADESANTAATDNNDGAKGVEREQRREIPWPAARTDAGAQING